MASAQKRGKLIVVSGPSGVGKGTVLSRVFDREDNLWKSVSATTRAPRAGEKDGVDYFFIDRETFKKEVEQGGFIEWAEYSGNLYGTPLKSVEEHLERGENVILEIDVQGALQIRDKIPSAVLVFIEPPSLEELKRRLSMRETETEEAISMRMNAAKVELSHKMEYDRQFVNDDIERCADELARCINAL